MDKAKKKKGNIEVGTIDQQEKKLFGAMASSVQNEGDIVSPLDNDWWDVMEKESGLSMDEFLRRAASSCNPSEDEKLLEGMICQMNKTTAQAGTAIDEALELVEASNKRIAAMEKKTA